MTNLKDQIDETLNRINRKTLIVSHMLDQSSIKVEVGQEWSDPNFATGAQVRNITSHHSNDDSSIIAADGPAGCRMEAHYHTSAELLVCAKGMIRLNVAGKEVILSLLDSYRIPAETVHSVEFLDDSLIFMIWSPKFPEV